MRLHVKLLDATLTLEIDPSSTVAELREAIAAAECGVPAAQQKYIKIPSKKIKLADLCATLASCNVCEDDTLQMTIGPAAASAYVPTHLRPAEFYHSEEFDAPNVWEVDVPIDVIDEARATFEQSGLRSVFEQLRASNERHRRVEVHATDAPACYFAVHAGSLGQVGASSTAPADRPSDLTWISVDDAATHARFDALFRRLRVEAAFTPVVDHARSLAVYSAFFV